MNREQMNRELGLTEEALDDLGRSFDTDTWDRDKYGSPKTGRPLAFGEPMKPITFKAPVSIVEAMNRRAQTLGLSRSDYLRSLVDQDLKIAETA